MAKHQDIRLNKSLGQHFLNDRSVLSRIYEAILACTDDLPLLEVGPGAGALSALLQDRTDYKLVEFDKRWVEHLEKEYPLLKGKVIAADFLQLDLQDVFAKNYAVVGNFPYNISSQIVFHILDHKDKIPLMLGMFQKEVAARICAKEGSKTYGVISVLTQLYYETEYLFDVPREAFNPPPKVLSGVMVMKRRVQDFDIDQRLFKQVVKLAFNQRRKTLRNSLKQLLRDKEVKGLDLFNLRPEQLSLDDFLNLVKLIATQK